LQYCPEPSDISYIVTATAADGKHLEEFKGKLNGTRLIVKPGDFEIDVFPAKSIGLGWECKNSTFSGDSYEKETVINQQKYPKQAP
jgi:hypothetical protein